METTGCRNLHAVMLRPGITVVVTHLYYRLPEQIEGHSNAPARCIVLWKRVTVPEIISLIFQNRTPRAALQFAG